MLGCTGRADPHRPVPARPGRPTRAAALFPDPAYPDSFYYVDVARQLAAGHGFNVDFIWIFPEVGGAIPANPVLPIPSNAHWMPLASLVQVPFIWLLGPDGVRVRDPVRDHRCDRGAARRGSSPRTPARRRSSRSARASSPRCRRSRSCTWSSRTTSRSTSRSSPGRCSSPARGLRGSRGRSSPPGCWRASRRCRATTASSCSRCWARSGCGTGCGRGSRSAATARVPPASRSSPRSARVAAFALWSRPGTPASSRRSGRSRRRPRRARCCSSATSGSGTRSRSPPTLDHLLGMGLGPLLLIARRRVRRRGVHLLGARRRPRPRAVRASIGAWHRRRDAAFGPYFGYAILLFAFSALVSAVHVPGGTFIHSAVALAPHFYVLALRGIVAWVEWIAARRRGWNVESASRVFVTGRRVRRRWRRSSACSRSTRRGTRSGRGCRPSRRRSMPRARRRRTG